MINLMFILTFGKRESDVQEYIPDMVSKLKEDGFAYESEGCSCCGRYGRNG